MEVIHSYCREERKGRRKVNYGKNLYSQ